MAVLRLVREQQAVLERERGSEGEREQVVRDIAASFQAAVADVLLTRRCWQRPTAARAPCVRLRRGAGGQRRVWRRQLAERMTLPVPDAPSGSAPTTQP